MAVVLELRPNCELCDRDLPPDSDAARICTYECTFCVDCVKTTLHDVCPNCGGGFERRPVRPAGAWRETTGLGRDPASTHRRHSEYTLEEIASYVASIRLIPPAQR